MAVDRSTLFGRLLFKGNQRTVGILHGKVQSGLFFCGVDRQGNGQVLSVRFHMGGAESVFGHFDVQTYPFNVSG